MTPAQVHLLVDAAQQLSLARNLDRIMEVTRNTARALTGADGATFILRDQDKCFYADENAISPLWKGQRFPLSACISGWAMLNKKHVAIEDIYTDERIPVDAYRPTFAKSLAMVPIRTIDPIGAIGNYWAAPHRPTEEEIMLLQLLADLTSVSIENYYVYSELESRVAQRTEQLTELNKDLDAFSYSVSHDLRTPLRAVNGFTEILLMQYADKFDEEGKEMMGYIIDGAKRMSVLIESLLEFSRMGRREITRTDVDMNGLTEGVIIEIEKSQKHNAAIDIGRLPNVKADHNLMHRVMINLVSNAIKYSSKKNDPRISISCEEKEKEHVFSIADNGAGFNMKYADKLFGTFQRFHSENEFEGVGVGLSLVKKIVTKHGGKIWADAEVDRGATFFFSLPKE